MIYSSHNYSMGANDSLVRAAANAPITKTDAVAGKQALARMKSVLISWLKYRELNDRVASGANVPAVLLKSPKTYRNPAAMAIRLRATRQVDEQDLATQLYQLLGEIFDPQTLPEPNIRKNPDAAVELAKIAVAGKLPGEASAPAAQGFVWLWPLVIVVGAIAFVITSAISSSAEAAKERERIECIKAGACTDYGFWLKVGAIAFISWLAWDKLGVGTKVKRAIGGG